MKLHFKILFLILFFVLPACKDRQVYPADYMKPAHVDMKCVNGRYRIFVDDREFFIKGAGYEYGDIQGLARHGANTFRTWCVENGRQSGMEILELAHQNGLMVVMGLDLVLERHGFDYNDTAMVRKQYDRLVSYIDQYKNHPALLAWGIGNELNLRSTNPKVWKSVNDLAAYIHRTDGNHPTTTMLSGISKTDVDHIREYCPDIDFISVQMYADVINLSTRIRDAGYKGPFLISEWGATGHWEVGQTSWNAPIEQSSTEKADAIRYRYENVVLGADSLCMGSFVFLWGQKQECTPTWYGLFSELGEETEAVDIMHYYWTGSWPENRSPRFLFARFNDKGRNNNINVHTGQACHCEYKLTDPDDDSLSYRVEILEENSDKREGGDHESRPPSYPVRKLKYSKSGFEFSAPEKVGPYRLFIYAMDGHNHVATINFPFFVIE